MDQSAKEISSRFGNGMNMKRTFRCRIFLQRENWERLGTIDRRPEMAASLFRTVRGALPVARSAWLERAAAVRCLGSTRVARGKCTFYVKIFGRAPRCDRVHYSGCLYRFCQLHLDTFNRVKLPVAPVPSTQEEKRKTERKSEEISCFVPRAIWS